LHIGYYRTLTQKKHWSWSRKKQNKISVKASADLLHTDIETRKAVLFPSQSVIMQNSCVVERTCFYDLITHTHTHMIHWQVDPRSRISIQLQVPAKNEARNEWGTFSPEECFKNCNLPFHSNAKSKASACRNIAQLMFELMLSYFSASVLAATVRFYLLWTGTRINRSCPSLCPIWRNVRSPQIFQVCQECHKTARFSQVTLCKETKHNLLAFGVPEDV